MATVLQRESTEYLYHGIDGDPPSVGAEVAVMSAGARPESGDWENAIVIPDDGHALWADAIATGLAGDYYVALLVGPFDGNPIDPGPGDYQVWIRLTDVAEQPVRIAPVALEVA